MIGLTGRDDVEGRQTNLSYLRRKGHWADEDPCAFGKELIKTPRGRAGLDIFDCDLQDCALDPRFQKFKINELGATEGIAIDNFTETSEKSDTEIESMTRDIRASGAQGAAAFSSDRRSRGSRSS